MRTRACPAAPLPAARTAAGRLLAPAAALTILLLIAPVTTAAAAVPAWPAWTLVTTAGVSFAGAVLTARRDRPDPRPLPVTFIALLAAVTVAVALAYRTDGWQTLFSMLAVAVVLVLPVRATPPLVAVTAALAVVVPVHAGSFGEALWGTALTTFLTGITTYGFRRMGEVIEELGRTRERLAVAAVSAEHLRFSGGRLTAVRGPRGSCSPPRSRTPAWTTTHGRTARDPRADRRGPDDDARRAHRAARPGGRL